MYLHYESFVQLHMCNTPFCKSLQGRTVQNIDITTPYIYFKVKNNCEQLVRQCMAMPEQKQKWDVKLKNKDLTSNLSSNLDKSDKLKNRNKVRLQ